jgi:hypothetical protein
LHRRHIFLRTSGLMCNITGTRLKDMLHHLLLQPMLCYQIIRIMNYLPLRMPVHKDDKCTQTV